MIMHWRKWSRRRRITTIATLIAIIVVTVYVVVSVLVWRSFQSRIAVAMTDIEAVVGELQSQDLTQSDYKKPSIGYYKPRKCPVRFRLVSCGRGR